MNTSIVFVLVDFVAKLLTPMAFLGTVLGISVMTHAALYYIGILQSRILFAGHLLHFVLRDFLGIDYRQPSWIGYAVLIHTRMVMFYCIVRQVWETVERYGKPIKYDYELQQSVAYEHTNPNAARVGLVLLVGYQSLLFVQYIGGFDNHILSVFVLFGNHIITIILSRCPLKPELQYSLYTLWWLSVFDYWIGLSILTVFVLVTPSKSL